MTIIYKEVVLIDGKEYQLTQCDYTDSIEEAIKDGACTKSHEDICDWIHDDIVNSSV